MKFSLCNEVLSSMSFADQCDFAAKLGYQGLEIAPFTLADDPQDIGQREIRQLRRQLEDSGLKASSLHWLMLAPPGLSISDPDPEIAKRTKNAISFLCNLAADLGAECLVHGSPEQRNVFADSNRRNQAEHVLSHAADAASSAGVTYCIEPLGYDQTDYINTFAEAKELVSKISKPSFATMLDCSAADSTEPSSLRNVLSEGLRSGHIRHVQVNDANRRGPGQGKTPIGQVLSTLVDEAYGGWVAVEPFDYVPDGPACAARAIGFLQGLLEMRS